MTLGRWRVASGCLLACLLAGPAGAAADRAASGDAAPLDKVGVLYEFEDYNDIRDWSLLEIEWSHKYPFGSVIGRVNLARRFGEAAEQYEIDAYPKITRRTYAYLNVGFAADSFFPERRYGGELFWNLPKRFEASLGFRRLEFENSDVTLYTGSLGYYQGNYYYSFRPYVARKPNGTSRSGHFLMRRWFGGREDYWTLRVGTGSTPDADLDVSEVGRLRSSKIELSAQKVVRPGWILRGNAGYRDQDFGFDRNRRSVVLGAGFQRLF